MILVTSVQELRRTVIIIIIIIIIISYTAILGTFTHNTESTAV